MRAFWYAWKAQFSWGWLFPAAGLAVVMALVTGDAFRPLGAPRSPADLAFVLEVYLPLMLALLASQVPVLDRDAGAAELHLTWCYPAPLHLLRLAAVPVMLWATAAAVTTTLAHALYAPMDLHLAAEMALYPAAALAGAALGGSALARHQVGGMAASALWWAVDLMKPGALHRWGHLFPHFRPLPDLDLGALRLQLLAAALFGLAVALWVTGWRERWVSGDSATE